MKKSETISQLAVALVKFNAEVGRIKDDAKNPHFKNNYATVDHILDTVRPLLAAQKISVLQFPGGDEHGNVTMTTMLLHESGEWVESDLLVMKPVKNDPQGFGSCTTYARRYSLASILSLSTGDTDDDGNQASGRVAQNQQRQQMQQKTAPQTFTAPDGIIELWKGNYELAGMKYNKAVFDSWYTGQRQLGKSDQELENLLASKMAEKATANV